MILLPALLGCTSPPIGADAGELPVAEPGRLRLLAVGDIGHGGDGMRRVADAAVAVCAARGCDVIALLGDLLYPAGMASDADPRLEDEVISPYGRTGARLLLVLGNHDYGDGRDREKADRVLRWAARTGRAALPAPYYTARAGPADLIVTDTSRVFWGDAAQQTWVDDALAASDRRWTVVLGHHTWRSEGPHGNAGAYEGLPGVPWASGASVSRLLDGVVCGRADLYVGGHDHSLQLLPGPCGGHLVVSGAGGAATGLPGHGNEPIFAASELGFSWFDLSEDPAVGGSVTFFDADGAVLGRFDLGGG